MPNNSSLDRVVMLNGNVPVKIVPSFRFVRAIRTKTLGTLATFVSVTLQGAPHRVSLSAALARESQNPI